MLHYIAIVLYSHCFYSCRRLLEKQERVDAIIASLEQSGADETQKEEILQTITPAEKTQLTKVKHIVDMYVFVSTKAFIVPSYLIQYGWTNSSYISRGLWVGFANYILHLKVDLV